MLTREFSYKVIGIMILLSLVLSACNFPGFGDEEEADDIKATETSLAQTLDAMNASPTATEVSAAPVTPGTPSPTLPAAAPTTPPPPPTTGVPTIQADVDTNCRQGPSTLYPVLGYLLVGQTSTVQGRHASSSNPWWFIENPKKPGQYCWVWGQTTRVTGDTSMLPVITPPPPPTLTPTSGAVSIAASFVTVHNCGGNPTAIFSITNTGGVTIESVNLTIKDLTTNTTVYSEGSNSPFMASPGSCPPGASSLPPGATAYVGGAIGPIPVGNQLRATAKLCTGENLSGACLTYKFDWGMP